jgi:plasmid stabilization system protein ParE
MDQVLAAVLRIVHDSDVRDPELLFTVIGEVYEEVESSVDGVDLAAFRTRFVERAGQDGFGPVAEELIRHAESEGGIDVFRAVRDTAPYELLGELSQLDASASAGGDEPYDEDVWRAFLAEYGESWDGQEENWRSFTEYFLYYAEERAVLGPARSFIEHATEASDRAAFFAGYGIDVTTEGADGSAEPDPAAWEAFLTDYGIAWDGKAENWDAFVPYFQHYATERGVQSFAQAFIDNAPDDVVERIAYFGAYGVVIEPDGAAAADADDVFESLAGLFDPEQAEQAQQQFAETVAANDAVTGEAEEAMKDAFAQLLVDMPEAANLTRAQMAELVATIPAEEL